MTVTPAYDVVHATSPAQLHALSHPTRHKILRALGSGDATISQLSNRLGINKGNVAHHLAVLARTGLARKGTTRTVRGGCEQYFIRTAQKYLFDPDDDGVATKAMFETIAEEIPADGDHLLNHRVVRLTAGQAKALRDHLESVVEDLKPANPNEHEYGILVGLYKHR